MHNRTNAQARFEDDYALPTLKDLGITKATIRWVSADVAALKASDSEIEKARACLPVLNNRAEEEGFRIVIDEPGANFGTNA